MKTKSEIKLQSEKEVESFLNSLARRMGINFNVVVKEGATERREGSLGETDIENRIIFINRYRYVKDALFTFFHEVIETYLNSSYKSLFTLLNAQNEVLDKVLSSPTEKSIIDSYQQRYIKEMFYAEKEKAIEEIVSLILKIYDGELNE
jgi:hypothetical protein